MLHCLNTSSGNVAGSCSDNMTVLERQRERERINKWEQQQQQHQPYFSGTTTTGFNGVFPSSSLQLENSPADSGMGLGLPTDPGSGFDVNSVISRTYSCPPALEAKHKLHTTHDLGKIKFNSSTGKEISTSFNKRKADKPHNTKIVAQNDHKDKRIKVGADDGESKITACADTCPKENSKASEVQKPDYIHVRARRGQATDSHSLAERIRRGKISERMKYLQDLVPGCNKITGKAGMLDEIINYVQSLQRQVEFLSMKLAAVNPKLDFNMDDLFAREMVPACAASNFPIPTIGMSSEMTNPAAYLHFNSPQQIVPGCGLDTGINPPDVGLRRTLSAPVSVSMPETFLDSSSCFTQILPSSTWEGDFQNLLYNVAFDQARATSFPSQLFTGLVEASNLKMEM